MAGPSRAHGVVARVCALVATAAASASWPQLRAPHAPQRQLQTKRCRSVALRLLPPPAIKAYEECFKDKLRPDSSHDWSVPGAEVSAQLACWCRHNLTTTMQEYGCCNHEDVFPMCSVDCGASCESTLAKDCVAKCPSMCFEAAEYVVNSTLCTGCNWVKCWPVLGCLAKHAETRVERGDLQRTCHETDFRRRPELKEYWQCWKNAPKHSSHWNVLSSIVNCICREGMQAATKNTSCCGSVLYGGGACDLECVPEQECMKQAAQTCVNSCQLKCPSMQMTPSKECMNDCLAKDAPCRRYVSCRAMQQPRFICDDGLWPEGHSGCCIHNTTGLIGCPKLCESERIWRLDRQKGVPWWARWHTGKGIVAQCSCSGCPSTASEGRIKLKLTVEEGLWDNGQTMLVDIARRENLRYGPNRKMQELMVARNEEILKIIKKDSAQSRWQDRRIAEVNERFGKAITIAARDFPDEKRRRRGDDDDHDDDDHWMIIVIIACTVAILAGVVAATCVVLRRKKQSNISAFQHGENVVVGQPIQGSPEASVSVFGGTAVTVAAPMKAQAPSKEVS